jgi:ABC-type dipeptide/oligopeptide/nickel transport system permease component
MTIAASTAVVPAGRAAGRRRGGRGWVVARRLRDGFVVLLLVLTAIFVLGSMVGDPAESLAPRDATQQQVDQIRANLGLDRPLLVQAGDYYSGLVRGDMGDSLVIARNQDAFDIVMDRLPATIRLTVAGLGFTVLLGVVPGIIAGLRPNSWFDRVGNIIALAGVSFPYFWFGQLLILVVAVNLGWVSVLPSGDLTSYLLPGLTLGIHHGGRLYQLVRSATLDELGKSYVTVAQSKGLSAMAVVTRHILRNIGLVLATMVGWEYARMWGGTVFLVEFTFAWPGVGKLVTDAAKFHDFNVIQAGVVVAGVFVVLANLVVDLLSSAVDRRVEVE